MPPTMSSKTAAIKQGIRNAIANDNLNDLLKGRDPSHSRVYHVVITKQPKDIVNRIPEVKEFYYLTTREKNQCADTPERKVTATMKKNKFAKSMETIKRQEKREVAEPISPDEHVPSDLVNAFSIRKDPDRIATGNAGDEDESDSDLVIEILDSSDEESSASNEVEFLMAENAPGTKTHSATNTNNVNNPDPPPLDGAANRPPGAGVDATASHLTAHNGGKDTDKENVSPNSDNGPTKYSARDPPRHSPKRKASLMHERIAEQRGARDPTRDGDDIGFEEGGHIIKRNRPERMLLQGPPDLDNGGGRGKNPFVFEDDEVDDENFAGAGGEDRSAGLRMVAGAGGMGMGLGLPGLMGGMGGPGPGCMGGPTGPHAVMGTRNGPIYSSLSRKAPFDTFANNGVPATAHLLTRQVLPPTSPGLSRSGSRSRSGSTRFDNIMQPQNNSAGLAAGGLLDMSPAGARVVSGAGGMGMGLGLPGSMGRGGTGPGGMGGMGRPGEMGGPSGPQAVLGTLNSPVCRKAPFDTSANNRVPAAAHSPHPGGQSPPQDNDMQVLPLTSPGLSGSGSSLFANTERRNNITGPATGGLLDMSHAARMAHLHNSGESFGAQPQSKLTMPRTAGSAAGGGLNKNERGDVVQEGLSTSSPSRPQTAGSASTLVGPPLLQGPPDSGRVRVPILPRLALLALVAMGLILREYTLLPESNTSCALCGSVDAAVSSARQCTQNCTSNMLGDGTLKNTWGVGIFNTTVDGGAISNNSMGNSTLKNTSKDGTPFKNTSSGSASIGKLASGVLDHTLNRTILASRSTLDSTLGGHTRYSTFSDTLRLATNDGGVSSSGLDPRTTIFIMNNVGLALSTISFPPRYLALLVQSNRLPFHRTPEDILIVLRDSLTMRYDILGNSVLPPFFALSHIKGGGLPGRSDGMDLLEACVFEGGVAVLGMHSTGVELLIEFDNPAYADGADVFIPVVPSKMDQPFTDDQSTTKAAASPFLLALPPHYAIVTPLPTGMFVARSKHLTFQCIAVLPRQYYPSCMPELFLSTSDGSVVVSKSNPSTSPNNGFTYYVDCRKRVEASCNLADAPSVERKVGSLHGKRSLAEDQNTEESDITVDVVIDITATKTQEHKESANDVTKTTEDGGDDSSTKPSTLPTNVSSMQIAPSGMPTESPTSFFNEMSSKVIAGAPSQIYSEDPSARLYKDNASTPQDLTADSNIHSAPSSEIISNQTSSHSISRSGIHPILLILAMLTVFGAMKLKLSNQKEELNASRQAAADRARDAAMRQCAAEIGRKRLKMKASASEEIDRSVDRARDAAMRQCAAEIGRKRLKMKASASEEIDRSVDRARDAAMRQCVAEIGRKRLKLKASASQEIDRSVDRARDAAMRQCAAEIGRKRLKLKTSASQEIDRAPDDATAHITPEPAPRTLSESEWDDFFNLRPGEWRCHTCQNVNLEETSNCLCRVASDNADRDLARERFGWRAKELRWAAAAAAAKRARSGE